MHAIYEGTRWRLNTVACITITHQHQHQLLLTRSTDKPHISASHVKIRLPSYSSSPSFGMSCIFLKKKLFFSVFCLMRARILFTTTAQHAPIISSQRFIYNLIVFVSLTFRAYETLIHIHIPFRCAHIMFCAISLQHPRRCFI